MKKKKERKKKDLKEKQSAEYKKTLGYLATKNVLLYLRETSWHRSIALEACGQLKNPLLMNFNEFPSFGLSFWGN